MLTAAAAVVVVVVATVVVLVVVSALMLLLFHSAFIAGKLKVSVGACKGLVKPELCQEKRGKLPLLPRDGPDTARKERDSTMSAVVALASMAP